MRADFYHRCLQWPVLDELIAAGQYPLLAPGFGALNEMIVRPAERAGIRYEADLAQRILDETGKEPGALALMAYALSELWQVSSKGGGIMMTHAAYDSFNGVRGAIGKRAEDTFKETLEALELEEAELQAALDSCFSGADRSGRKRSRDSETGAAESSHQRSGCSSFGKSSDRFAVIGNKRRG